jgi:hypothetical protein
MNLKGNNHGLCLKGLKKIRRISVRRLNVLTEIQTKYLLRMSLEHHQCGDMTGNSVGSFNEMYRYAKITASCQLFCPIQTRSDDNKETQIM